MTQLQSQALGISLAIITAIGVIAYEKLVKNFSIGVVVSLAVIFYVPFLLGIFYLNREVLTADLGKLVANKELIFYAIIYVITWLTVPLWYVITKNQGAFVGSLYEVKYIVVLGLFYAIWGDKGLTLNTGLGLACALASIYFISK